jgi:hypothetical protein
MVIIGGQVASPGAVAPAPPLQSEPELATGRRLMSSDDPHRHHHHHAGAADDAHGHCEHGGPRW